MTRHDTALPGYQSWAGHDPFEDHAGPYFFKTLENGEVRCAFRTEPKHLNGGGAIHGGALMTFADYALFAISKDHVEGPSVTVSFNAEFTAAGHDGDLVEARGEVVQETGSMVFVRGQVFSGDTTLLNFSGIIKKVRART